MMHHQLRRHAGHMGTYPPRIESVRRHQIFRFALVRSGHTAASTSVTASALTLSHKSSWRYSWARVASEQHT